MERFSNYQFSSLRAIESGEAGKVGIEELKKLDQRTIGSLLRRKYFVFVPGEGLQLSKAGQVAFSAFMNGGIPERKTVRALSKLVSHYISERRNHKAVKVIRKAAA